MFERTKMLGLFMISSAAVANASVSPTVEIAPGVLMPVMSVGTWVYGNGKPTDPSIAVGPW
jgi:hypothetical protein